MAVSVVALVAASVVAAGTIAAGGSGDATAALVDSTTAGPTPDAVSESDSETATANETTATNGTTTTTTTERSTNRTSENGTRWNGTTRAPKETRTPNETTESGSVGVLGESGETGSTPPAEPPSGSSDPGGPGSSDVTDPSGDVDSSVKVDVRRSEPAAVDDVIRNVEVRNAEAHQSVSVDVSPAESRADVTFDRVEVTPTTNTSFTLNVTASEDPIAGETPAANLSNGTEPLAFVSVDHSISDRNVSNVTFTFRVRKERVNASEVEEIALYRYHGGSWNELPTTLANVTDTHFVYRVRSPGLSEFAAGKQRPQFEITDAGFEFATLSVGDALGVRVRITNQGDADGTFTADLVLDGETVASHKLTIAAGGIRQTTFDRRVAEPGTYEVYVNDFRVGEVTVNETVAASDGPTSPTSVNETSDTDADADEAISRGTAAELPGLGLWTAVGSLVAALVAARRFEPE